MNFQLFAWTGQGIKPLTSQSECEGYHSRLYPIRSLNSQTSSPPNTVQSERVIFRLFNPLEIR